MAYFGLRQWQFISPNVLDIPGAGARIDLSRESDAFSTRGLAFVQQETPIGSDGVALGQGDTLRDVLAIQALKDAWFANLGTRPDGDTLDQLLFDHLEAKADPTGTDTARPLELAEGRLETWLGAKQIELVPFANGTTRERAAFVRMVQRVRGRLDQARTLSQNGTLPPDLYLKLLTVEARKLAVNPTSLRPKKWRADESPIEPTTTVTSTFTNLSGFSLTTGAGTWTASNGLKCYRDSYSGFLDTLRNTTPVSSNDNWADMAPQLVDGASFGNGTFIGPMCRNGSSGTACYMFGVGYAGGTGCNAGLSRFPTSGLQRTVIGNLFFYVKTFTPNTGLSPTFRCKAVGSTITGYGIGNGQTFSVSATDTNVTTGLYGGIASDDAFGTSYATMNVTQSWSFTDGVTPQPVVTSEAASGTTGVSFTYTISATNSPTSYGASGLPSGLSVNSSTGVISGTPTASGVFSVSLSATNAGGTGTGTLTLTVVSSKKVSHGKGSLGGGGMGKKTGLGV